jgi:hypothetical protein
MSDNSYNGWTNWETWNMALWLDNDEGFYNLRRCTRRSSLNNMPQFLAATGSAYAQGTPDMDRGDIYRVNWDEILDAWDAEEELV